MNLTKTAGIELLALQSVAANAVVISSAQDVSTKLAACIFIHFGRRAATALTQAVEFRIEASSKASGDGHWYPLARFVTQSAAAEAEAVSGTVNAGTNVVTVASTSNLTEADLVFIDNSTIANSEWGRIKDIATNTSITLEENLANAQTGSTIYDSAEMFVAQLDLSAISRIRLVVDADNSGQAIAVEAHMVTADSIG
jgi:hypothetical protein